MPSKRIRSKNPAVAGGGGGATTLDVPTARWSEDATVGDDFRIQFSTPEDATVDDALAYLLVKEGEDATVDDVWTQFIQSAHAEDATANDLVKLQIITLRVGRSGTPDSDLMFDAWTEQTSTGLNNGNSDPLAVRGVTTVTPGNDERRGYIAIDLTGFSGCTALTGLDLVVRVNNSNTLTATTLTCTFTYTATKPFTESTVTWASPPTIGTAAGSATASIAAGGAFANYTFSVSQANLANVLGNWLLCTFTGPSGSTGLLRDNFQISSRDGATDGNRPAVSFTAQRGT